MTLNNPSSSAAGKGNYTGDDSANRSIPHGVGSTPALVIIICRTETFHYFLNSGNPTKLRYINAATPTEGNKTVTAMDSTNFYVGDGATHDASANKNTIVYDWIAFK